MDYSDAQKNISIDDMGGWKGLWSSDSDLPAKKHNPGNPNAEK